jgi:hypothetical protein
MNREKLVEAIEAGVSANGRAQALRRRAGESCGAARRTAGE